MQNVRVALPLMKGDGYTKRVALGGGNGLSLSAHSAHQKEAWAFLTFLMQPENQVALHLANGTVPMLRTAFMRDEFRGDPFTAAVINAAPYLLNFDRGETTPAYAGFSSEVGSYLRDAVIGKVSVAEGLAKSAQAYQVALDSVNAKQ
ncbi:MAG TPA: extracellular solute-binding protein [Limnochordia bacterium]|nr:extracellular solute-binding protein [Limnochordia bacterium]